MHGEGPQPASRRPDKPANDGLYSWKEIAAHLKCSERTARRWERAEGLPVHRHQHQKKAAVFAYSTELDAWWNDGGPRVEQREKAEAAAGRRRLLWLAGAVSVVGAGIAASLVVGHDVQQSDEPHLEVTPLTTLVGMEYRPALSPDGTQVAFAWNGESGSWIPDLYVKAIDASRPRRLTRTAGGYEDFPAWSPDGRDIAFFRSEPSGSGIFTVPAAGGPEKRLVSLAEGGRGLDWSPDGRSLAFPDKSAAREPSSIYVFSTETLEKRRVTSPPEGAPGDTRPAFSPDGSALAFVRAESRLESIFILRLEGGELQRLITQSGPILGVAWAEDGRSVIYSAPPGQGANNHSLWRIRADGGVPERMTSDLENARAPTISRRGNRLAYERFYVDVNVWRLEVPGEAGRAGSPGLLIGSTREDAAPQYSPDGQRIAFQSDRSGTREIWLCDSDGSNPAQLTFLEADAGSPRWSVDGRQIAFRVLGMRGNRRMGVYVIAAEGGIPRALSTGASDDAGAPSWSRDGEWIYFGSERTGRPEIWRVPADGAEPVQITRNGGGFALESPDGRFLYYVKPEVAGLWRMSVTGGVETRVFAAPEPAYWGSWAVVDDGIYFVDAFVPPHGAVSFYSLVTRQVKRILAFDREPDSWDVGIGVSPDGRWILYGLVDSQNSDLVLVENLR